MDKFNAEADSSMFFKLNIISLLFLTLSLSFLSVSAFALDCRSCAPGACYCNVTECATGTIDIYSTNCTSIPNKEFIFSNSTFLWTQAQSLNYNFRVLCDSGTASNCTNVNLSAYSSPSTTTTTITTTTTYSAPIVQTCPYDCCVSDPTFQERDCPSGYSCVNYQCIAQTTTTTPNPGFQVNYSIVGILAIVIIFAILAFYLFRGRKPQQKDKWGELYKKYGRRS